MVWTQSSIVKTRGFKKTFKNYFLKEPKLLLSVVQHNHNLYHN